MNNKEKIKLSRDIQEMFFKYTNDENDKCYWQILYLIKNDSKQENINGLIDIRNMLTMLIDDLEKIDENEY